MFVCVFGFRATQSEDENEERKRRRTKKRKNKLMMLKYAHENAVRSIESSIVNK